MSTNWLPEFDSGGGSKYRKLVDSIRQAIADGDLAYDEKLPPVRELAYQLQITPGTVARAYSILVDEGVLRAGVGRGTFVADRSAHADISAVDGVIDLISPRIPELGQEALIREAIRKTSSEISYMSLMQYPQRAKNLPAREAFMRYMDGAPLGRYTVDDLVTTHGGQNAIVHVMQAVLKGPEPVVLIDEIGYSGIRKAAELCRATLVGVPWDGEGPDPEALEKLIQSTGAQLYCTTAEVNNPTTRVTQPNRRKEIAAVARKYGLHVLDDDCYYTGDRTGESYRALLPELGWYVASPSKLISPALRVGFTIPPVGWVGNMLQSAQFGHFGVSTILTEVYAKVMTNPKLPEIIDRVQERINADLRIAVNQLGGHAIRWRTNVPLVWIELPNGWRGSSFAHAAETAGVVLKSADEFTLRDGRGVQAVRVALNCQIDPSIFEEGVRRLRKLLDNPPRSFTT